MTFDDDDYLAVLQQPVGEPPAEDEDSMHEAIEQYLRERGLNFIGKGGPGGRPAQALRTAQSQDRDRRPEFTKRQLDHLRKDVSALPQHPPDSCDAAISSNVPQAVVNAIQRA